jgi:hypothetical protein
MQGCTTDPAVHVKPKHATGTARPWLSVESRRCTPTALVARTPVRYMSVDTATRRSTALQGDTRRDREETARIAKNSQLAGRFPRVWQVLGSNQRRLSRRFYSPLTPPESPRADQRLRRSRHDSGLPPSVMRPWFPEFGAVPATDGGGPAHGRTRKKPRTGPVGAVIRTAPTRIPALTCHFRMPARCRRHPRHPGLARRPGCRGRRRCVDWRQRPGRRCSGRRS